ncbi:hypothetical protein BGZ58_001132 [Dissophora ornata]|nr:hypothetical protein BGZ58_001132 [Dissophora ornata]
MDESVSINANGLHAPMDGGHKRKSHPSPMADGTGSPVLSSEPKKPKTSEFSESSQTPKNTEVTQVEFNDILANILHVVHGLDKQKVMTTVAVSVENGGNVETSIHTIRSKLREAQYSSILAFKDDISNIFKQSIVAGAHDSEKQNHAQKLLQLASDLISDKSHYTIRSHGKKVRSREESQITAPERDFEKVALFQRAPEGFVFTSTALVKDESLDQDVAKTVVVPTASVPNPPLLKDINTKPRPASSVLEQSKKKSTGVEYCPYSPFMSFAPFVDSSNADMNAEDTSIAYTALMARVGQKSKPSATVVEEQRKAKAQLDGILEIAQQYQAHENGMEIKEADLKFLKDDGLDIQILLDVAQSVKANGELLGPQEAIQKNATLLFELYKLQEERFASKDQTVGDREKEIAASLHHSLMDLAGRATPSTFVTPEAVEEAIRKIPYRESVFAGTLPPNKPFAFPTNAIRNGLPPTATGYPTHNPVAHRKSGPPTTIIPQVALSPHGNMTGGYPSIPQPSHYAYSIPQQPTHQKTYSRPRANNTSSTPAPLQINANGELTFRKNFHTVVTSTGAIWRLGVHNEKLCNACGQYNKKWNGLHRPVSLFPNTQTPTFRK